jgi:hypothetical protein
MRDVNPLEWLEVLARFRRCSCSGVRPTDDSRPAAGGPNPSPRGDWVAGELHASNLIGGPSEQRLLNVVGKIAPRTGDPSARPSVVCRSRNAGDR